MTPEDWRSEIDDLDPSRTAARTLGVAASRRTGERGRSRVGHGPPLRVAFQGDPGAFSEDAARAAFGGGARLVSCATLEDLFARVEAGGADIAVAPAENTLFGAVQRCYDLLLASTLQIVGESVVHVRHQLIGCRGATLAVVRTVESHPVALGQCERFLSAHPHFARAATDDTAASVRRVCALGDRSRVAIGSRRAARLYGGVILRRDLQDHPRNYTRFLLLARPSAAPLAALAAGCAPLIGGATAASAGPGPDGAGATPATAEEPLPLAGPCRPKLALAIKLEHAPGSLHRALAPFARRSIDLLRIESRPIPGEPWRYLFYLDLQGTPADPRVLAALAELAGQALSVRLLGCFLAAAGVAAGRRATPAAAAAATAATRPVSTPATHRRRPNRQGRKANHVA